MSSHKKHGKKKLIPANQIFCPKRHGLMTRTVNALYDEMQVAMYHCIQNGCTQQALLYIGSVNLNHLIKKHHNGEQ